MTLSHWRDIALLILIIEALLGSVFILILTLIVTSLVRRTTGALRAGLRTGQVRAATLAAQTDAISRRRAVQPTARVHAALAGARAFGRSLVRNSPLSPG